MAARPVAKIVQVTLSSAFLSLEQFATHGRDAQSVRGCCLDATLQLGEEALRLGVARGLAFVRWSVRDDPDFIEHWALALDEARVLDPTAAQVDGNPGPLRRMDDYPPNFMHPRRYPVEGVMSAFGADGVSGGDRFSRREIWSLHRWLFRHDLRAALARPSPRHLLVTCSTLARTGLLLVIDALMQRAFDRLARLTALRDG